MITDGNSKPIGWPRLTLDGIHRPEEPIVPFRERSGFHYPILGRGRAHHHGAVPPRAYVAVTLARAIPILGFIAAILRGIAAGLRRARRRDAAGDKAGAIAN